MSKHNTMTSTMSDILPQQQRNLQQLQNLQNRTRSLGIVPNEFSNSYLQKIHEKQMQQSTSPILNSGQPELNFVNTDASQQETMVNHSLTNSYNNYSFQNNTNNTMGTGVNQGVATPTMNPASHLPSFQGKTSITSGTINHSTLHPQRSNQQQDPRSPLVILIPTSSQPTDILAQRFGAWRNVIKSLITYLSEIASIQDEIVRQQLRLTHSIQFPFFSIENTYQPTGSEDKMNQSFFLPLGNGSVQDLPTILSQYHGTLASNASKASKELSTEIIPRLEDLRRDLLVKIKEIKFLQSDFKNSCSKELQQTKQDMRRFLDSIAEAKFGSPKQDPYLTKIILDKQIKKQITEENFLHEAYDNLENSAAELERVVVMEIQNALTIYARLIGQQSQIVFDVLISKLDMGFFSKDPRFEWDSFIARDPNFIPPNIPTRKVSSIVYKNQFDPLTHEVKTGYLEKRSKFLKSYSKGYYVLTPSFLHEFKTADRKKDIVPIMSLSLSDCAVAEHSKKGSSDFKFILHSKQNGLISRGHNWVFKSDSYESMMLWFTAIKELTSMPDINTKVKYITTKLKLDSSGRPLSRISSNVTFENNQDKLNDENMDDSGVIPGITISSPRASRS
ncbi:hypothetical protein Kpol_1039p42 [Vanderwaltozyma polyspora DSM 70294]|uniref:PH domain-containing protein n=1 Tax=Vanderwaltozyma polyspora (strain ATCC 22028 / DSM 70294 / BCRC 21397 / CBS 2163 / NBRC 10782 / NRRL Y-8283 / UCD 57-17) TaxID=436907 RepID=A7THG8_VANPO|nr:uncharacterized protein Kpol_1039p42 [Vanderwaltozyma polyspora DSM 70294]EDO18292.1 hypothetical protein Kpol_1039p42 [Vanderwaltozyma polyspora DSM 70294]